jgi:hypothetical protein
VEIRGRERFGETTDRRQLQMLDNIKAAPRLIRVASRLALVNINVARRIGSKTWLPAI